MSDLISRETVIDILKQTGIIQDNDIGHCVIEEINRIPTAYSVDKVVERLNKETIGSSIKESLGLLRAIEIVKHGGVSDDVCEWELEDEEANLYLTGCQQRQLIFEGTPKENGYRYCPYCGKKIKVVE